MASSSGYNQIHYPSQQQQQMQTHYAHQHHQQKQNRQQSLHHRHQQSLQQQQQQQTTTQNEQFERELRNIMFDLDDWRELILHFDGVLDWQNPPALAALFLAISGLFAAYVWFEPNILMVVGLFGIAFSLLNFVVPKLLQRGLVVFSYPASSASSASSSASSSSTNQSSSNHKAAATTGGQRSHWSNAEEEKYRHICTRIAHAKTHLANGYAFMSDLRRSRPVVHFFLAVPLFLCVIIVGGLVNNVLLAYLTAVFFLLVPGLRHRGILQIITSRIQHLLRKTAANSSVMSSSPSSYPNNNNNNSVSVNNHGGGGGGAISDYAINSAAAAEAHSNLQHLLTQPQYPLKQSVGGGAASFSSSSAAAAAQTGGMMNGTPPLGSTTLRNRMVHQNIRGVGSATGLLGSPPHTPISARFGPYGGGGGGGGIANAASSSPAFNARSGN